jgi:phytoene dehydrogenase-like protein
VVVGGGHNGLVCAAELGRSGWRTVVLEAADELGGAVRSAELTLPGLVHDVFSTNQGGFAGGPFYAANREALERHGLRYAHSDRPFANVFPDGTSLRVYQGAERTLEGLAAHDPADAEGWAELHRLFARLSPALLRLYGSELTSPGGLAGTASALAGLGRDALAAGQLLLSSTRELGERYLATREAKALLACWGMHLDYGPDVPGGALFPFIEAFSDMEHGMVVAEGGASRLPTALAALVEELGGEVRTGARVSRILVEDGRAAGVELASGEVVRARRAVVASVTPTALYERLLAGEDAVPADVRSAARRFRYGPATMMVHLALSDRVPWKAGDELASFAYVHVAPYVEDLADTYTASVNGRLPESPLLVVGQTTAVDPTRAPAGAHVLWIQVRTLPRDADWAALGEGYADTVLRKLEEYAPGLGELVLDRTVLTPADLERWDENLVGGDSLSGSHHPAQFFAFRPLAGRSPYTTPVGGLYLTGASTWPGGGVTGLPGLLAARRALDPRPWRRLAVRGAAAAGGALLARSLARRALGRRRPG